MLLPYFDVFCDLLIKIVILARAQPESTTGVSHIKIERE